MKPICCEVGRSEDRSASDKINSGNEEVERTSRRKMTQIILSFLLSGVKIISVLIPFCPMMMSPTREEGEAEDA